MQGGNVRLGGAGEHADALGNRREVLSGLGQFAAAQVAEQRLEGRRECGKNADGLFQAVADRIEMTLGQTAQ